MLLTLGLAGLGVGSVELGQAQPATAAGPVGPLCGTDVSASATATASSSTSPTSTGPERALDADAAWSGWFAQDDADHPAQDDEHLTVDLGAEQPVCALKVYWARAADYDVQVSTDGVVWTTVDEVRGSTTVGLVTSRFAQTTARWVRVQGVARATADPYGVWDLRVLGPTTVALPTTDLFGPNVLVLDPGMPAADVQAVVDAVYEEQEDDQFGTSRHQLLLLPGEYDVDVRLGFTTSLSGTGRVPGDVVVRGDGGWVDAAWFDGNATQNFWRSAENLTVDLDDPVTAPVETGPLRWAVAQAAPMRRVQVLGDLALDSTRYGWASGGYVADTAVTGTVTAYAQQQWYTRDSSVGGWDGGVWNMVFSGVTGPLPDTDAWPTPPATALDTTGPVAEKPYLYRANTGWRVAVPDLRDGTTGTTWAPPTTSLAIDDFYVAQETDSAATIQAALDAGRNLIVTPGVYHLDRTLEVTEPGTVVLGLGYATLVPEHGGPALHVADVDGVRVAGLVVDAPVGGSTGLVVVGDAGSHTDHAADPTVLQDVVLRVGGATAGSTGTALAVHADDTLLDHVWAWRADHGTGVGWGQNTADVGVHVTGDDVHAYGLFSEHFQTWSTRWSGERGRTVFYQNELPYDVPDQAAWQNGAVRGYAGYKVDEGVTTHEAWGLGVYSNFTEDTDDDEITVDNGFEVAQTPGVVLHRATVVSLGGEGNFAHVVNGVGDPADGSSLVSRVAIYPTGGEDPVWPPTVEPTPTPTPEPTSTPTPTPSVDPTPTPEPTPSPEPTSDPTPTPTPSPEPTPDPTPTPTPSAEPTPTPTPTPSATPTPTPTPSVTPAPVPTSTPRPTSAPSPTATPRPSGSAAAPGTVRVRLPEPRIQEDGRVSVVASGLRPGEAAQVWMYSDPVLLGVVTTDADGRVVLTTALPPGTRAGTHTVVVVGLESGLEGRATLQVLSDVPAATDALAATGGPPGAAALVALVLVTLGASAVVVARRRTA